jgi:hypothetical protein
MRAAIAGSILAASGLRTEVVGTGGIPDWLADHPLTAAATALRA